MLGLKEVANKNIMRKEEEDRKIEAKKNIEKMFVDFINENILLHNDVVVIKEDNNDLDKDVNGFINDHVLFPLKDISNNAQ